MVISKDFLICQESHLGPVPFRCRLNLPFFHNLRPRIAHIFRLPLPERLNFKHFRQGIHRLDTHSIQAHRLFECLRIVFCPGVHLGRSVHQFAQRYPPPVIPDSHHAFLHLDDNLCPCPHGKLINRIVHHFLYQNVNTVIRRRTIPQLTYIHARAQADMLPPVQCPN